VSDEPGFELIAELDPPGSGAWQGASRDITTGEWFLGHSLGSGDGKIYRFGVSNSVRKPYKDTMVCKGLTHIYGFAAHKGELWLPWNDAAGNDIVTIGYVGGKTFRKSAGTEMHVFTDGEAQVSFSPTREGLVVCETVAGGYTFSKRLTEDVRNNKDDVRGKVIRRPKPDDTWLQGFSVASEYLYIAYGKTAEKSWIERWSFATGEYVDKLDVSDAGFLPGENRSKTRSREIECMDGRTFSIKIDHDNKRKLRVYDLNNF
jgi:hypothetical protein